MGYEILNSMLIYGMHNAHSDIRYKTEKELKYAVTMEIDILNQPNGLLTVGYSRS